jgi:hypothetical protein
MSTRTVRKAKSIAPEIENRKVSWADIKQFEQEIKFEREMKLRELADPDYGQTLCFSEEFWVRKGRPWLKQLILEDGQWVSAMSGLSLVRLYSFVYDCRRPTDEELMRIVKALMKG